ncbi:unnamed protein product [Microthlaspi erraticum]|uniref:F-box domain-containing protein n=1 Tax=Microthlaspi erraticum TaxID=1685480 RepID=A0A6D2HRJ9_9BRAS|nr:unnamed protein product [Microthlaspi erraticum]
MKKKKQKQKVKMNVSDPIPSDLLMDIFSRVPAKSIFRFRCLSKFWRSTLGLPYFTELFLTKSLARPRLLFAIQVGKELLFFSSPQPQNPADNSTLVATPYNMSFPRKYQVDIRTTLSGQVFLYEWQRKEWLICNPVTGESSTITLPEVKAKGSVRRCYVGYDQINKQFKVLCTTWSHNGEANTHRVLTLGSSGKPLWRSIECNINISRHKGAHYVAGEICINGVVYCGAHYIEGSCMMVCFDFCSEIFSFIKIDEGVLRGTLVNYKGKLGVLGKDKYQLMLWVLEEDAGKHKWSKSLCVGSRIRLFERIGDNFHILGMTGAGEIVLRPHRSKHFYIVYYNIERDTFTRVNIQGFEQFKDPNITPRTFLDYVENIKLL